MPERFLQTAPFAFRTTCVPALRPGIHTEGESAGRGRQGAAKGMQREQEKENSFITKVILLLFSMISFITYLLGYRPLKKIVNDPNLSVYQKYVQLKESNSMWGCVGCLFSILFPPFPLGIIYFLMVRRLRKQQLSAMVCEKCGEKNSQQVSRQNEGSVINYFFICRKCGHIHQESIKKAVRLSSQISSKSSRKDDSYGSSSSYNRSSSSYNKSYRSGGGASTKF